MIDEELNRELGKKIEELSEGKVNALEEINEIIGSTLRAVGNFYYKDKDEVEDRISDLYILLVKKASKFAQNENASGWIMITFQNQIKDHLRRKKKEAAYSRAAGKTFMLEQSQEGAEYIERHTYVNWLMEILTEEEKTLIIAYFWLGYTIRELAKM